MQQLEGTAVSYLERTSLTLLLQVMQCNLRSDEQDLRAILQIITKSCAFTCGRSYK